MKTKNSRITGFSMVELLIAMSIMIFVSGGIYFAYKYCNTAFFRTSAQITANRQARLAAEKIMRVARNANWHDITYTGDNEALCLRWDNADTPSDMTLGTGDDVTCAFYFTKGASVDESMIQYDSDIYDGIAAEELVAGAENPEGGRVFSASSDDKFLYMNFTVNRKYSIIPYQTSKVAVAIDFRNE